VAELKKDMKKCRYCGKYIKYEEVICEFCGFNCETGALDPTFDPGVKKDAKAKGAIADRLKAIFATALFIIAIIVLYNAIRGRSDYLKSFTLNIMQRLEALKPKSAAKNPSSTSGGKPKELVTLGKTTLPDKAALEKRKKFLTLEGIAYISGDKRFITINGEVLAEGDTIASVIVGKIKESSVELLLPNGEAKSLEISQSIPIPAK
jgi:hypothetical protein